MVRFITFEIFSISHIMHFLKLWAFSKNDKLLWFVDLQKKKLENIYWLNPEISLKILKITEISLVFGSNTGLGRQSQYRFPVNFLSKSRNPVKKYAKSRDPIISDAPHLILKPWEKAEF